MMKIARPCSRDKSLDQHTTMQCSLGVHTCRATKMVKMYSTATSDSCIATTPMIHVSPMIITRETMHFSQCLVPWLLRAKVYTVLTTRNLPSGLEHSCFFLLGMPAHYYKGHYEEPTVHLWSEAAALKTS